MRDDSQRYGDEDAEDRQPSDISAEQRGPADDARVRRHGHVHREHDAGDRQPELHRIEPCGVAEAVDDRHQDDEADIEEHRDRQQQGGRRQRTGDTTRAEQRREPSGEARGAAGELDDSAEHRPEGHEDGDGTERAAHPGDDRRDDSEPFRSVLGGWNGGQRHACGETDQDARDEQREERVDFEFDDQQQQQAYACGSDRQEEGGGHECDVSFDGSGVR